MRYLSLLAFVVGLLNCLGFTAASQTAPTWNWTQQIGGTGRDRGVLSAADASGNIYQTGSFVGTLQVGATVMNSAPLDMYLVKYNRQGVAQWAQQARVQNANGQARAEGITVVTDPAGNVYVAGTYNGTVTFGALMLTSTSGAANMFVVKYTSQGTPVWAITSSSTGSSTSRTDPSGLAATTSGEVFVSGLFMGTTNFAGLSATSQGGFDVFLVKLTANGVPQWIRSGGGTGTDYAAALAVAPNNGVYMSGGLSGTATFGSLAAISRGGVDAFLMQYDSQGTPQWLQTYGGSSDDGASILATATNGEIYMVGYFQATAYFGNYTLLSQGANDGFVVKCTAQGTPLWANSMGGTGTDGTYGAAWSPSGALYVAGTFSSTASFGTQRKTSAGGTDVFVARYEDSGALSWVEQCGGPNNDYSAGVAAGTNGTVFVGGQFSGTAQFGPLALVSRGLEDGFIFQLQDNVVTSTHSLAKADGYEVYPNPLTPSTSLILTLPVAMREPATIEILDMIGKTLQRLRVQPSEIIGNRVIIGELPVASGTYLMKYTSPSISISKRVQVQ